MATRSPSGPATTPGFRPVTRGSCFSWLVGVASVRFSFARSAWPPVGPTAVSSITATATPTTRSRRRSAPVVRPRPVPSGAGLRRPAVDPGGGGSDVGRGGGTAPSGVVGVARSSVGGLVVSTAPYGASTTNKTHACRLRITLGRAPCSSGRIPGPRCGPSFDRPPQVSRHVPPQPPDTVHAIRSPWLPSPRFTEKTARPSRRRDGRRHGHVAPTGTRVEHEKLPRFET